MRPISAVEDIGRGSTSNGWGFWLRRGEWTAGLLALPLAIRLFAAHLSIARVERPLAKLAGAAARAVVTVHGCDETVFADPGLLGGVAIFSPPGWQSHAQYLTAIDADAILVADARLTR